MVAPMIRPYNVVQLWYSKIWFGQTFKDNIVAVFIQEGLNVALGPGTTMLMHPPAMSLSPLT